MKKCDRNMIKIKDGQLVIYGTKRDIYGYFNDVVLDIDNTLDQSLNKIGS